MKLIVGLGNPGLEYENTRHNIGYMFLDHLFPFQFLFNKKFNSYELDVNILGERVIFVKPATYMNLSGEALIKYVNFYKINLSDILVIQDDLDMEFGKYKFLYNRGDGGHNGIKNIVTNFGSREFLRLKFGISRNSDIDVKDYVLSKFTNVELEQLSVLFDKLNQVVYDFVNLTRDMLISKYN